MLIPHKRIPKAKRFDVFPFVNSRDCCIAFHGPTFFSIMKYGNILSLRDIIIPGTMSNKVQINVNIHTIIALDGSKILRY